MNEPNPVPKDEREIQDMVHALSKDIEKHRNRTKQFRRIIVLSLVTILVVGLLSLVSYLLFLNFSVKELKTQVEAKDRSIKELEESINSLMYQEQLREEIALTKDVESDENLISQVSTNISYLKEATVGYKGKNVVRGNTNFREIALTFDLATGEELMTLLRLLEKFPKIKVTVFLSNERSSETSGSFFLRQNLDNIKQLAKTNRVEFGNHTWSHFNYLRSVMETSQKKRSVLEYLSKQVLDLSRMAEEMERVETIFKSLTGQQISKIYRLPYGALNQLILDAHSKLGYQSHIMWSSNAKGSLDLPDYIHRPFVYKNNSNRKKEMIRNPLYKTSEETLHFLEDWEREDSHGMNGAIILMHLGGPRKFDKLIHILPNFIESMRNKGYNFVTVTETLNDKLDSIPQKD